MDISILIPTYARPNAINNCLNALAQQTVLQDKSKQIEIIIAIDGPESQTPTPPIPQQLSHITALTRHPRSGYIKLRHEMQLQARGKVILWLNDDAYAQHDLIETHLDMHAKNEPCVIAGAADWKAIDPSQQPSLFDLLVQQSDLVFFKDAQRTGTPRQTNYRNCYGLNMSFPRDLANQAGGIPPLEDIYGYDDIEIAFRLQRAGAAIIAAPHARVVHDHRMKPVDVHRREYRLGYAAWFYARLKPSFAADLFNTDITDSGYLEQLKRAQNLSFRDALRIEESFLNLETLSPDSITADPNQRQQLLDTLAQHWIPLKRYLWRRGLLHAAQDHPPSWSLLRDQPDDQ